MVHNKTDHEFTFRQLSYGAKPNYQPYVKLLLFFNKKDGVSYEQFLRHWQTVHADLTVATEGFRVSNIQRYTQTHQTADRKSRVKSAGADSLDFDGCSEMWVKSWDDWVKLANSPEFAKVVAPDGPNFVGSTIRIFAGQENVIVGKAIHPQGKDDIQSSKL